MACIRDENVFPQTIIRLETEKKYEKRPKRVHWIGRVVTEYYKKKSLICGCPESQLNSNDLCMFQYRKQKCF